jgi:hypothetical protein
VATLNFSSRPKFVVGASGRRSRNRTFRMWRPPTALRPLASLSRQCPTPKSCRLFGEPIWLDVNGELGWKPDIGRPSVTRRLAHMSGTLLPTLDTRKRTSLRVTTGQQFSDDTLRSVIRA